MAGVDADQLQAQVDGDVADAYQALASSSDMGLSRVLSWFGVSAAEDAVNSERQATGALDLQRLAARKWETVHRSWAEAGHRDDGSPYTWDEWRSEGEWLRHELEQVPGDTEGALSVVAVGRDAGAQTLQDVGHALPWALLAGAAVLFLLMER